MKILAIDCGKRTGWAYYGNGIKESGVEDFSSKRGESRGMLYVRFRSWLEEMIIKLGLTKNAGLVIYEMPHHRGGAATQILYGLTTRIEEECENRGINYTTIHSTTLKKFATGSGRADKDAILKMARQKFGDEIYDHNEADALFMAEYAKKEFEN
jgi:hypothetical protein